MSDEKLRILKMLESGAINADEAKELLNAVESPVSKDRKARWLKIRVYENYADKPNVRVTVPISLVKLATKLGGKFQMAIPEEAKKKMAEKGVKLDAETLEHIDEMFDELAVNGRFDLVNIVDEEDGDRVEIFVE